MYFESDSQCRDIHAGLVSFRKCAQSNRFRSIMMITSWLNLAVLLVIAFSSVIRVDVDDDIQWSITRLDGFIDSGKGSLLMTGHLSNPFVFEVSSSRSDFIIVIDGIRYSAGCCGFSDTWVEGKITNSTIEWQSIERPSYGHSVMVSVSSPWELKLGDTVVSYGTSDTLVSGLNSNLPYHFFLNDRFGVGARIRIDHGESSFAVVNPKEWNTFFELTLEGRWRKLSMDSLGSCRHTIVIYTHGNWVLTGGGAIPISGSGYRLLTGLCPVMYTIDAQFDKYSVSVDNEFYFVSGNQISFTMGDTPNGRCTEYLAINTDSYWSVIADSGNNISDWATGYGNNLLSSLCIDKKYTLLTLENSMIRVNGIHRFIPRLHRTLVSFPARHVIETSPLPPGPGCDHTVFVVTSAEIMFEVSIINGEEVVYSGFTSGVIPGLCSGPQYSLRISQTSGRSTVGTLDLYSELGSHARAAEHGIEFNIDRSGIISFQFPPDDRDMFRLTIWSDQSPAIGSWKVYTSKATLIERNYNYVSSGKEITFFVDSDTRRDQVWLDIAIPNLCCEYDSGGYELVGSDGSRIHRSGGDFVSSETISLYPKDDDDYDNSTSCTFHTTRIEVTSEDSDPLWTIYPANATKLMSPKFWPVSSKFRNVTFYDLCEGDYSIKVESQGNNQVAHILIEVKGAEYWRTYTVVDQLFLKRIKFRLTLGGNSALTKLVKFNGFNFDRLVFSLLVFLFNSFMFFYFTRRVYSAFKNRYQYRPIVYNAPIGAKGIFNRDSVSRYGSISQSICEPPLEDNHLRVPGGGSHKKSYPKEIPKGLCLHIDLDDETELDSSGSEHEAVLTVSAHGDVYHPHVGSTWFRGKYTPHEYL